MTQKEGKLTSHKVRNSTKAHRLLWPSSYAMLIAQSCSWWPGPGCVQLDPWTLDRSRTRLQPLRQTSGFRLESGPECRCSRDWIANRPGLSVDSRPVTEGFGPVDGLRHASRYFRAHDVELTSEMQCLGESLTMDEPVYSNCAFQGKTPLCST